TTSQPSPSSILMDSAGSSRGAKIRILGLDMEAPCVLSPGGMVQALMEVDAGGQSSLIPLSLNAFSQRTASLRKKASNSSGVLDTALIPAFSSLSAVAGSA